MHLIHKGEVTNPSQLPRTARHGDVYCHLGHPSVYVFVDTGTSCFWDRVSGADLDDYKGREDIFLTFRGVSFNLMVEPGVKSLVLNMEMTETEFEALSMFFPETHSRIKTLAGCGRRWSEADQSPVANYENFLFRLFRRSKK